LGVVYGINGVAVAEVGWCVEGMMKKKMACLQNFSGRAKFIFVGSSCIEKKVLWTVDRKGTSS